MPDWYKSVRVKTAKRSFLQFFCNIKIEIAVNSYHQGDLAVIKKITLLMIQPGLKRGQSQVAACCHYEGKNGNSKPFFIKKYDQITSLTILFL